MPSTRPTWPRPTSATRRWKPVEDQEHFAPGVADQALQEADQHRRLDRAIEHLPAQLALVAHRRDQTQPDAAVIGPHDGQGWPKVPPSIAWWNGQTRGFAGRGIGAATHVVGAQ